jgi:hypothetical protein
MFAARGKVRAEAVAANILHLVLVGQRRNGTLRVLAREVFLEKDKVGEAAAQSRVIVDKGLEIGVGGDEVRDEGVLGAFVLLLGVRDAALEFAVQTGAGEVDVCVVGGRFVLHGHVS